MKIIFELKGVDYLQAVQTHKLYNEFLIAPASILHSPFVCYDVFDVKTLEYH